MYKGSERLALSLEASCGLAPGLSESSPHLPTLPSGAGKMEKIHASGHSVWAGYPDTTGERRRNTTLFTQTLTGKAARQRVPRANGEVFTFPLPQPAGHRRVRRGLVHNLSNTHPCTTHTHSGSLFWSTDGHTPKDHSLSRRKHKETRDVASVLV